MRIGSLNLSAIFSQFAGTHHARTQAGYVRVVNPSAAVRDSAARHAHARQTRIIDAEILAKTVTVEALPDAFVRTEPVKDTPSDLQIPSDKRIATYLETLLRNDESVGAHSGIDEYA